MILRTRNKTEVVKEILRA